MKDAKQRECPECKQMRTEFMRPEVADYNVCRDCFEKRPTKLVDAGKLKEGVRVGMLKGGDLIVLDFIH